MPLNKDIKKVVVIGSGPIVIGQAAEFDYAGTQACRALREDGVEVVLINSNPATIMTDEKMAAKVYIEPLTLTVVKRIIEKEKPDSILSTLGGQTGLTLSMQLAKDGFLDKHGVRLLGARPDTIDRAEDRQRFKDTMEEIGQPCIPSKVVNTLKDGLDYVHNEIGYPVIIRPAFTLGGTGGGICNNDDEMNEICRGGLELSPIHQVLVEKCISGWKEIEFEVVRDSAGNKITVCSMENVDPVGIHTGDSIVVAPALTLSDKEYEMLRTAALDIVEALKVEGGCNVQFALDPNSFEYAVIEVNPRVSRSSALASKATGYPIARVATKIAVGYTLDEITNKITNKTAACFEPTIDYIVVKFPKWPFDKFVYASRKLGTQMKATGEVMAIAPSFEAAMMKAVRGAEIKHPSMNTPAYAALKDGELLDKIAECTDERIFLVWEALKRGVTVDKLYEITKIDRWFLNKFLSMIALERRLASASKLTDGLYLEAKKAGYPDAVIEEISGKKIANKRHAVFKMVDTCAAEFSADTPYFYSTFDEENEAAEFLESRKTDKKTVIVFGSGPIRIGQGIEFDYASVHCVWALKEAGYDVVIVNNNPETVSTDFDTADRLYFEPLTPEDVESILEVEKPWGVVVAFGGQTAIKLTKFLSEKGERILGTPADSIDAAEDRERFDALLEHYNIRRPAGHTVMTEKEALAAAADLGYPVLMRPSYVLGGQNMIIAFSEADIREYMKIILAQNIENPVLIDKYLGGTELEVDAICDGEDILIPGIMEHIERAGIHSGDSIAVYPAWNVSDEMRKKIVECTKNLAVDLKTMGLINIQYLIYEGELYVIEVNPRSSRTVPYISKVTKIPMVDLATRAMLGEKIKDMGYGTGLYKVSPYVAVKVPIFSFEKLQNLDTHLGPEMKSTGEVLGIAATMDEALYKGLAAAGYSLKKEGGVFITVRDSDKPEIAEIAKQFYDLGFTVYATAGTAAVLKKAGIDAEVVGKIHESDNNAISLIESGRISYVVSTSTKGRMPERDSVKIRRKAVERAVPCLTSLDTAGAVASCIKSRYSQKSIELVNINDMRHERQKLRFVKIQTAGNDYIYFDCFDQKINNPEGLAVRLSDRHFGVGGDGVVMMYPSDKADARMKMYNTDGSEGLMAGNAIRGMAKYLYDAGRTDKTSMTIETASGIRKITLYKMYGVVNAASVDMGALELKPEKIPATLKGDRIVSAPLEVDGVTYLVTCLSVGNPHCVVFCDEVETLDIASVGPYFEHNPVFPEGVNTEFVKVQGRNNLKMRVWERGSGETWSCGTGATAAAIAAVLCGYADKGADIKVKLLGGELTVNYTDDLITLRGNAEKIYEGIVEL